MNCDTCKHFYPFEHADGPSIYGECRRYPPTQGRSGDPIRCPTMQNNGSYDYYYETSPFDIVVHKGETCGEFCEHTETGRA